MPEISMTLDKYVLASLALIAATSLPWFFKEVWSNAKNRSSKLEHSLSSMTAALNGLHVEIAKLQARFEAIIEMKTKEHDRLDARIDELAETIKELNKKIVIFEEWVRSEMARIIRDDVPHKVKNALQALGLSKKDG